MSQDSHVVEVPRAEQNSAFFVPVRVDGVSPGAVFGVKRAL